MLRDDDAALLRRRHDERRRLQARVTDCSDCRVALPADDVRNRHERP
jgi:hypothetical protein